MCFMPAHGRCCSLLIKHAVSCLVLFKRQGGRGSQSHGEGPSTMSKDVDILEKLNASRFSKERRRCLPGMFPNNISFRQLQLSYSCSPDQTTYNREVWGPSGPVYPPHRYADFQRGVSPFLVESGNPRLTPLYHL